MGPQTHALVIGVSDYEFLPKDPLDPAQKDSATFDLSPVDCGASAAFQFATWLRDSYNRPSAPLGTVRLLISPSTLERTHLALDAASKQSDVPPARAADVQVAIDDWADACADPKNVAILYVAGHGIEVCKDDGVVCEETQKFQGIGHKKFSRPSHARLRGQAFRRRHPPQGCEPVGAR